MHRTGMTARRIAGSLLAVHCTLAVGAADVTAGAAPAAGKAPTRLLFLGNSITLHGPSAKVSWTGNWGMAASAADKDYVHVLSQAIADQTGSAPTILVENIAAFEREYSTFDAGKALRQHLDFKADVLVLAIGENVAALTTAAAQSEFRARLQVLLTTFKEASQPRLLVRSCFWPDPVKDGILKDVCAELGGTYVDIGALAKDERHFARSERSFAHAGVANHPGDQGMQAIADALFKALTTAK